MPGFYLSENQAGAVIEAPAGYVLVSNGDGTWSPQPGGGGGGSGELVKVSPFDGTADFLVNKLEAGSGLSSSITIIGDSPPFEILVLRAGGSALNDGGLFSGSGTLDLSESVNRRITLMSDVQLTLTGLPDKTVFFQLHVVQGAFGSALEIEGAKTPGGNGLALSTTIGHEDIILGYWDGSVLYASVLGLGFA